MTPEQALFLKLLSGRIKNGINATANRGAPGQGGMRAEMEGTEGEHS